MECSPYRVNSNYIDRHKYWFGASMDELTRIIANMNTEKNITFFDWLKYHQETHEYQTDIEYRTRLLTDTWRKQLGTAHFRDDHKFFMLFIQAHAAANKHPNQSVDLIFIDDFEGFAKNFHAIVSEVPHPIPINITFKPI